MRLVGSVLAEQHGISPTFGGWAWLVEPGVRVEWRKLVPQAIAWAKLAHCDRVIVPVADHHEVAGAGRCYQTFWLGRRGARASRLARCEQNRPIDLRLESRV